VTGRIFQALPTQTNTTVALIIGYGSFSFALTTTFHPKIGAQQVHTSYYYATLKLLLVSSSSTLTAIILLLLILLL
jgi:hypothetical protein